MSSILKTAWLAIAPGKPHFVRDYNRTVLLERISSPGRQSNAMAVAVGGDFTAMGNQERALMLRHGLAEGLSLVDIGCGSGRLAFALRDMRIDYLGTDVVSALLDHARNICRRTDWRFERIDSLTIPARDQSADFVCAFSVFTHLQHEESYLYLKEARRVLKPGGKLVFSFLDFMVKEHWSVFETMLTPRRRRRWLRGRSHHNQFMDKASLAVWAGHLDFELLGVEDAAVGQSVCVMRKPLS